MKFVHRRRAQRFRVTQVEQLRAAGIKRVETRNVRTPLSHRVGIVLGPVIQEIVGGHQTPVGIGIQAVGSFIIPQSLVVGGSRKSAVRLVGRWNIFQQVGGRRGPGALGDHGVRKNAGRRVASGPVIGFAGRDRIAQLFGQPARPIRPAHRRRDRVSRGVGGDKGILEIGQIARTILE